MLRAVVVVLAAAVALGLTAAETDMSDGLFTALKYALILVAVIFGVVIPGMREPRQQ